MITKLGWSKDYVVFTEKVKTHNQLRMRTFKFSLVTRKLMSMDEEMFDPLTNSSFPTKSLFIEKEEVVLEYYTPDGKFSVSTKNGRKFTINFFSGEKRFYQGSLLFMVDKIITIYPALYLSEAEERLERFKLRFCTEKNCKDYKHMYLTIKSRGN